VTLKIMEFCGGHTHALIHSGVLSLLPPSIQMMHGPGCPVCVLPPHHIQALIDLLEAEPRLTVCVYGDLMRIPTLRGDSLLAAQGRGAKIKIVYSPLDVLRFAKNNPNEEYLFMAIGFETTAPATATLLRYAREANISNLSVLCLHVLTPPAIQAVFEGLKPENRPHAVIGPGHVTLVTGLQIYEEFAQSFQIPIVISGFEDDDLLESIELATELHAKGVNGVFNQYRRAIHENGHLNAKKLLEETFSIRPEFTWRGLGSLKNSALQLNDELAPWNAEKKFALKYKDVPEHPACRCGDILKAHAKPKDCKLFAKVCRPSNPMGACMVSGEGACSAYYQMGATV
jgi:hydrogenase expression/formation protein HypD